MNTSRHLVQYAAALLLALVVSSSSATLAVATPTPPTEPAPITDNSTAPSDPSSTGDLELQEIVQSWGLGPVSSLDPDAAGNRPDLTYEADPGAVIEDAVTVYNFGNMVLTFNLYATDAFNNGDGAFDLLPGDEEPTGAGSWVTMGQNNITVPPGTQVDVPITITVPEDARPGDHAGGILASNVTSSTDESGQIVELDRRTGTRLYLRVSGPLTRELVVADVQTSYSRTLNPLTGSAEVSFRVENRGNVRMSGTPTVSVAGPFGIGERTVTFPEVTELLPGGDVTITGDVGDVPALLFGFTTARIEPAGADADATLKASTGKDLSFNPPLGVLLVLLALIFGLLARRAYRRHRSGAQPGTTAGQIPATTPAIAPAKPRMELEPGPERQHQPS